MFWTTISKDGVLTIQTSEPLEAFALEQWEAAHKRSKANLKIDTSRVCSLEDFAHMIGKDLTEFNKWRIERQSKFTLPQEVEATLHELNTTGTTGNAT